MNSELALLKYKLARKEDHFSSTDLDLAFAEQALKQKEYLAKWKASRGVVGTPSN